MRVRHRSYVRTPERHLPVGARGEFDIFPGHGHVGVKIDAKIKSGFPAAERAAHVSTYGNHTAHVDAPFELDEVHEMLIDGLPAAVEDAAEWLLYVAASGNASESFVRFVHDATRSVVSTDHAQEMANPPDGIVIGVDEPLPDEISFPPSLSGVDVEV